MSWNDDPRLNRARQPGPAGPRVAAYRAVASERLQAGDTEGAVELYNRAVEVARGDESTLLPHTLRHLGDILRESGRFAAADQVYADAITLYRTHPGTERSDLANALRSLALMHEAADRVDEAISAWSEAKELYRQLCIAPGVQESDDALVRLGAI